MATRLFDNRRKTEPATSRPLPCSWSEVPTDPIPATLAKGSARDRLPLQSRGVTDLGSQTHFPVPVIAESVKLPIGFEGAKLNSKYPAPTEPRRKALENRCVARVRQSARDPLLAAIAKFADLARYGNKSISNSRLAERATSTSICVTAAQNCVRMNPQCLARNALSSFSGLT